MRNDKLLLSKNGEELKDVPSFTYLSNTITVTGGKWRKISKVEQANSDCCFTPWDHSEMLCRCPRKPICASLLLTGKGYPPVDGSKTWKVIQGISYKIQSLVNNLVSERSSNDSLARPVTKISGTRRKWAYIKAIPFSIWYYQAGLQVNSAGRKSSEEEMKIVHVG